jgi:hypothetical protein
MTQRAISAMTTNSSLSHTHIHTNKAEKLILNKSYVSVCEILKQVNISYSSAETISNLYLCFDAASITCSLKILSQIPTTLA